MGGLSVPDDLNPVRAGRDPGVGGRGYRLDGRCAR